MKKQNFTNKLSAYSKLNKGYISPLKMSSKKGMLAALLPVVSFGVGNAQCLGALNNGSSITIGDGAANAYAFDVNGDGMDDVRIRLNAGGGGSLLLSNIAGAPNTISFFTNGAGSPSASIFAASAPLSGGNQASTSVFLFYDQGDQGVLQNGQTGIVGFTRDGSPGFITIQIVGYDDNGTPVNNSDDEVSFIISQRGTDTDGGGALAGDCPSLPVELTNFQAKASTDYVALSWQTSSETENAGFELERSTDGKNFKLVSFIEGNGTTIEAQAYAYDDKTVRSGQLYYYRLKQIDFDGSYEYSEILSAQLQGKGITATISPNPSSDGQVRLSFATTQKGDMTVRVYDMVGRELVTRTQEVEVGENLFNLDLGTLSAGTYFVKMEQGTQAVYQKLMLDIE